MSSERNQTQKTTYSMIPFIWKSRKAELLWQKADLCLPGAMSREGTQGNF